MVATTSPAATTAYSRPVVSALPGVTTVRGAYAKRERKRVVDKVLQNYMVEETESSSPVMEDQPQKPTADDEVQTEASYSSTSFMIHVSLQVVVPKEISRPKTYSRGVQVYPQIRHRDVQTPQSDTRCRSTQCEAGQIRQPATTGAELPYSIEYESHMEPSSELGEPWHDDNQDKDFIFDEDQLSEESDMELEEEEDMENFQQFSEHERKYIVFESKLLELFATCSGCCQATLPATKREVGSMLQVKQECSVCKHTRIWTSQPSVGEIPEGNLLMTAGILFSGPQPTKTLRCLRHLGVAAVSEDTFYCHQKAYLHPAIDHEWNRFQTIYINQVKEREGQLTLGGDGRADTPGHSHGSGLHDGCRCTAQASLKKKLLKMSSQKECSDLSLWITSIKNHLYWVAASSNTAAEKQGQVMLEKWKSLENHLHNKHTHSGPLFPECQHPELEDPERKKKWLKGGTKLSVTLGEVLNSRQMLKDVTMLSTGPQTAAIEGCHSTLNHFAPKMFGFSFKGMLHRTKLAALHFNYNSSRQQATTKDGNKSFNLSFKKGRKEFSIQEIKEECDYCYVYRLMKQVISLAQKQTLAERLALPKQQPQLDEEDEEETDEDDIPPPICSSYQKPEKAEAVDRLLGRYNTSHAVNMDSCD